MNEIERIKSHKRGAFVGEPHKLDTIVFVHGLGGHFDTTWGLFPDLLAKDPELPRMDIYLWGYRSGAVKRFVHGTTTLGKHFVGEIELHVNDQNGAFLVGHSMGGLVILEGLVGQMRRERAQTHPSTCVQQISLFASPVSGSMAAAIAMNTAKKFWIPRWLFNAQIRSLARGEKTDALLDEVRACLYKPAVENDSARDIPIRMVMAARDIAVSQEDKDAFRAKFHEMSPIELDHGHSGVKLPESHYDPRYKALANDVKWVLGHRFAALCERSLNDDADIQMDADIEIDRRYGEMIRQIFKQAGGNPRRHWSLYQSYIRVVKRDATRFKRPPLDAAWRAVHVLRNRGRL